MMVISGLTKMPPLKPATGVRSANGSINIAMPRGGRPLVIANAMPAVCSAFTAAAARGVSTFSAVTRVPSTSARTSEIFEAARAGSIMRGLPTRVASARVRTTAAENEPLDRVGEAFFAIAVRHEIRGLLHLRTGIAHGNAETAPLEHRDIVAAIADDGDLRQRNGQQLRDLRQCGAFVGERMGDVEVVGLRTSDGSIIGERGAHIALTPCEKLEIPADADDLGGAIEGGVRSPRRSSAGIPPSAPRGRHKARRGRAPASPVR